MCAPNFRFPPVEDICRSANETKSAVRKGRRAGMSTAEIVGAITGALIVIIVLWQIRRHGTVPPTLEVYPDSRSGIGGAPD